MITCDRLTAPFITEEILHVNGVKVPVAEHLVEVRPVESDDVDAWLPLWKGYQRFYQIEIPERVALRTWERFLSPAEPMHAALAVMGDRALGFVHWVHHRSTWSTNDHCYLQDLFVAEDGRGRSVGRALIEHVYADAKHRGASRVYWLTHESNHDAMRLYDRIAHRTPFIQYRREFGDSS